MDKRTTFWNSFFLGLVLGAAGLYFLGTKKGREKLKEVLEILDNEEEILKSLEETAENLAKKGGASLNKILQELDINSKL